MYLVGVEHYSILDSVAGEVYRDLRERVVNNVMKEYYRYTFEQLIKQ